MIKNWLAFCYLNSNACIFNKARIARILENLEFYTFYLQSNHRIEQEKFKIKSDYTFIQESIIKNMENLLEKSV